MHMCNTHYIKLKKYASTNVHTCNIKLLHYNTCAKGDRFMSRKSIGINNDRYLKIERAAVDITAKTGKITKWSDIVNFLIDEYLAEAKQDMIARDEQGSKK